MMTRRAPSRSRLKKRLLGDIAQIVVRAIVVLAVCLHRAFAAERPIACLAVADREIAEARGIVSATGLAFALAAAAGANDASEVANLERGAGHYFSTLIGVCSASLRTRFTLAAADSELENDLGPIAMMRPFLVLMALSHLGLIHRFWAPWSFRHQRLK